MDLVFAYGSLTNRMEIEKTLKENGAEKDYVVLGIGKLEDYKLAFTKKSAKWNGGVLDVVTSRDHDYVLGLVIEVSDRALRAIDRREGVSVGAYVRKTVNVYLAGEMVEVIVYTVVNKERSGVKASEEYVSKVETGMREEGFPEEYINKYLIGEITEDCKHRALLFLRREKHAQGLFELAHMAEIDLWDIPILVDSLTKDGYIRQHKGDAGKYDLSARYFTVEEKRKEIDDMLLERLKKSFIPYESIDCINADLNHKTMACMNCLTTHKEGETFCRKCSSALSEIDTPILDIMFDLNKKGYKTEYCCCGHPTLESFYSAYFVVNGIINGITAPDGFTQKCSDHKTTITSIYVKKKLKLSTIELEELAKKNLSKLREWVIELPEQLGN